MMQVVYTEAKRLYFRSPTERGLSQQFFSFLVIVSFIQPKTKGPLSTCK